MRHLPTVSWATWRDTLCQLQLDVLVQENAVTFDWQALVRWVQELATSPERPAQDSSTEGTADAQLRAYRQQAVQALAELRATPHVVGPLLYALLTQLAQVPAVAAPVAEAPPGAGPQPSTQQPSPPALELPFPAPGPAVESTAPGVAETGLILLLPPPNPPGRAPRRPPPPRAAAAQVPRHRRASLPSQRQGRVHGARTLHHDADQCRVARACARKPGPSVGGKGDGAGRGDGRMPVRRPFRPA